MPYGTVKVDNITFTNNGVDTTITVSGLAASTTGNLTVTGTISGAVVRATTVSGVTVTGTTVQGASGTFTSITGGVATITSGVFALGSAAAPSISFSGDTDNGIYSPGANQVAISTSGTGRLFVTSDGLVGIGTSAPGYILDCSQSANTDVAVNVTNSNASSGAIAEFRASNGTNSAWYGIGGTGYTPYAQIRPNGAAIYTSSAAGIGLSADNASGYITFGTGSGATERMRLDSSGRLGIGTSSPSDSVLDVNGNIRARSIASDPINSAANIYALAGVGGTLSSLLWRFVTGANDVSAGTERMRLDSSGRLGIGTSAPGAPLHVEGQARVRGGDTGDSVIKVGVDATGNRASYVDLIGDTTYTTYGLRLVRNGGANGTSQLLHRGTGDYQITAQEAGSIAFLTSNTERFRCDSSGRLGIGISAPSSILDIKAASNGVDTLIVRPNTTSNFITFKPETASNQFNFGYWTGSAWGTAILNAEVFAVSGASEKFRCDSSGRLLVGTSSIVVGSPQTIIEKSSSDLDILRVQCGVESANNLAGIAFGFAANGARPKTAIASVATGSFGRGSLAFYVDQAFDNNSVSSSDEVARFNSEGYFKASNAGAYRSSTGSYHEIVSSSTATPVLLLSASSASFGDVAETIDVNVAAASTFAFIHGRSSYGSDVEFNLRGDGNGLCDGAWTGGGADYAEYFEWSDGNLNAEDRRGISVVLDGDKIREAVAGEDPIGVISGNPSIVGDAAWNKWSGKYLRDEFGTYILEDYEVTDDDGNTVVQQRRKLNPAYDPDVEYIPREQRPEWDCVGLMGKLRIRKGQVTGSRWIKMRDINDSVEEWLVR